MQIKRMNIQIRCCNHCYITQLLPFTELASSFFLDVFFFFIRHMPDMRLRAFSYNPPPFSSLPNPARSLLFCNFLRDPSLSCLIYSYSGDECRRRSSRDSCVLDLAPLVGELGQGLVVPSSSSSSYFRREETCVSLSYNVPGVFSFLLLYIIRAKFILLYLYTCT